MADNVIIVGVKRGNDRLSISEIMQMCGRAGRKHDGGEYNANIIIEKECLTEIENEIETNQSFEVHSSLNESKNLSFHLLPDICNGLIETKEDAEKWYENTLGAFQNRKGGIDKAIDILRDCGAIQEVCGHIKPTRLGEISSMFYFNSADVQAWLNNFNTIFNLGLECDDLAISWALGNVPVSRVMGGLGDRWELLNECSGNMPQGLVVDEGSLLTVVLWWSALGGPSVGKMRNHMLNLRKDFGRINNVLMVLDKDIGKWGKSDYFNELGKRMYKGIPSYLSELCKIPGITKTRADYLYNIGVKDIFDIKEMLDNLETEIDSNFFAILKEAVNGIY